MKSVAPDPDQIQQWRQVVRESNHRLAADGVIDASLLKEVECLVTAHRDNNLEKDCTQ